MKEAAGGKHQEAREAIGEGERPKDQDEDDIALPWPVPRTGNEFQLLVDRFLDGGATYRELADALEVSPTELRRRQSSAALPAEFRKKVRAVIAEMVAVPRSPGGLRRLVEDLARDGVEDPVGKLAKVTGVSAKSLKQYSQRRGALPPSLTQRLTDYYRR